MDITLEAILGLLKPEVILAVLKVAFPTMSDQIDAEIMKLRKAKEEKRAKFKKAVEEMDIPTINSLTDEFFD